MTATPPESFASRSCSFSRSKSEVVVSIWARICSTRPLIAASSPWPSTIVVSSLVADDAAGAAEVLERDAVELAADLLGDDLATGEDGDVAQHFLAAIAEARGLDGEDVERAAQLVDDQGRQRFAVDVLGDDDERLPARATFSSTGRMSCDRGDLLVGDQDVRLVELGFHALGVGDEVGGDVAAIDLHALGVLGLEVEALGLFDGDDAVLADLLHHLGDQIADLLVRGGDGGDLGDLFLALDGDGACPGCVAIDGLGAELDALLEQHRVRAGGDVAQALVDDGLGEHGGGGGAVTGDVVGLGGGFLEQLGAHVLEGSSSSISLATVTPSWVTVGAPNFLSRATLRPFGPSVVLTALARMSTPSLRDCRACSLNSISLATSMNSSAVNVEPVETDDELD